MGDVLLNGRKPMDRELPAIARARTCERERDLELLAGLLPGPGDAPAMRRAPRPVTDVAWEFGQ